MPKLLPKYPIYIPSKGRSETCYTAKFMVRDGVPFRLVVEPQERDLYAAEFGGDRLLILPENNRGLIFARNWMKDHAVAEGYKRHWQIDDNIRGMRRCWKRRRIPVRSGVALRVIEDFADRYENVALAGPIYSMFAVPTGRIGGLPPFYLNAHVYSCTLLLNELPHRFREPANEDVDMCLQVLADGWCTVSVNVFCVDKCWTMTVKGGQTDSAYKADGRLFMARSLERVWPGVVETKRRFNRPQHYVRDSWQKFDTPLKRRTDIDWSALGADEYGLKLVQVKSEVKSEKLRKLLADQADQPSGGLPIE